MSGASGTGVWLAGQRLREELLASAGAGQDEAIGLDTAGLSTKTAVLAAFGRSLGAGDDFGLNLDALYDVLRDVGDETAHDQVPLITWSGWGDLAIGDPLSFAGVLAVFEAYAEESTATVILLGDGPLVDLPTWGL